LEIEVEGILRTLYPQQVISTMPLSTLINCLEPEPPAIVVESARGLKYRDFLVVAVTTRKKNLFPDNWIYIHSSEVRVGRIQNFYNWSPDMVSLGHATTLGMEYFCAAGDDLWEMKDECLIELAKKELSFLGLVDEAELGEGFVIRESKAYPVYDATYRAHVDSIRAYMTTFANLQTVGRNGMHRYNNQDHSMLAGHHAALRVLGRPELDPWEVNTDRSYYEEQILSRNKAQTGKDILIAEKAMPH
jgi:protoporphyrinogen oxidase